jgi:hypothetical protein
MQRPIRVSGLICLTLIFASYLASCVTTPAAKPDEIDYQQTKGKLITNDGHKFRYKFYPSSQKSASVIFIPTMKCRQSGRPQGRHALAVSLNKANFNFITFEPWNTLFEGSFKDHVDNLNKKRAKSGAGHFPSIDGKESAVQNIARNEVSAIIEFIESAPTHDPKKGIYLIGACIGSMISLETIHYYPDKIKGVVFLSPMILPIFFTPDIQAKYSNLNISEYFKTLISSFGEHPGLAIGGDADFHPQFTESALDSARFLRQKIGPNIEVMALSTSLHATDLIEGKRGVRVKIVRWLVDQAYGG